MGGGTSSSKGKSQSWYKPATPFLNSTIPYAQQLLGASSPNSSLRTAGEGVLSRVLGGEERANSNARLENQMRGIADYYNEARQIGAKNVSGAANTAGNLWSTARLKQQGATDRQITGDMGRTMASLIGSNEANQTRNELGALGTAFAQGDADFNNMMRMLQAYGGMGTSRNSSSGWNVSI